MVEAAVPAELTEYLSKIFISFTMLKWRKYFLLVRKMHTRHIINMYGPVLLTVLCEVVLISLGYCGEFLDLLNWRYNCRYTIINDPRLQCVVKTGRKYQIFSRSQKRGKWKTGAWAHSIIVVSLSITYVYLYRDLCIKNLSS